LPSENKPFYFKLDYIIMEVTEAELHLNNAKNKDIFYVMEASSTPSRNKSRFILRISFDLVLPWA
jgi:hypothetical protein